IQSSGRTLLDLINGLLEMAKVEAGKVEIMHDRVDLREFAEALVALMRPVADKRGVDLRLEVAGEALVIETDGRKLQQIVFNLLSNAVKFTGDAAEGRAEALTTAREGATSGEGPPSTVLVPALVTLRIERLLARAAGGAAEQGKVRISVLDTGPGIAPEFQEIIFEKFTQLSRGLNRTSAGTGLGLAICRELTALLQGEIQVESALGRGAMFSVILPERLDPARIAESKLEARFRVSLSGGGRSSATSGG
ncbi:MAG: sensor histidine kinase, partial [Phycisphaerales bacterium]